MAFPRRFKQLAHWPAFISFTPSTWFLFGTAAVVGVVAGLGAILFCEFTRHLTQMRFALENTMSALPGALLGILMPTLGGMVIGLLLYRRDPELIGVGVAEVVESVTQWGGRLRLRSMLTKTVAAVICISTGGAVGREEPIVRLGSALGSAIGQRLRLPESWLRYVVASGAVGGIAVALHAPITAVLFALEVILDEYSTMAVGSVVMASVGASAMANIVGFQGLVISVPTLSFIHVRELAFYAVLGGLSALASLVFVIVFRLIERVFASLNCPADLKPVIGGLLIGVLGLYTPQIWGGGYDILSAVLHDQWPLSLIGLLMAAQIVATPITLGSGGVGGVLAPSLVIGALLGQSVGLVSHHLWPTLAIAPSTYALVGMAAVLATTTGAPLTAVLLVYELTGDAHFLTPLLLTTGISVCLAQYAWRAPLDTLVLWRPHGLWEPHHTRDPISRMQVAHLMTAQVLTVPTTMALVQLAWVFERTGSQAVLVVDPHGAFYGLLSLTDLKRALMDDTTYHLSASDLAMTTVAKVYPDERASVVMHYMVYSDLWCLPVVDRSQPPRLLGAVYREDLDRVYNRGRIGSNYHTEN